MIFLVVGIALLALKLAEIGAVADWPWWAVLLPFALATAWWAFADGIGLTQRRAMDKMETKKTARRDRNLVALGLDPRRVHAPARAPSRPSVKSSHRAVKDPTTADVG